jgi:hypothetical protein
VSEVEHQTKTKICTKCGQEKPLEEFYTGRRYSGGHRSQCKDCQRARRREHHRKHKERVTDMIGEGPICKICGAVDNIDFHHVSGDDKIEALSLMGSASDVEVKNELKKTISLCRSCHAAIHTMLERLTGSRSPVSASDTDRAIKELLHDREMQQLGLKWCPRCRSYQSQSAFHANSSRRDGLYDMCRACQLAYEADRRRKRKQALIEERTGQ